MSRFAEQVVIVTGEANALTEAIVDGFRDEGALVTHIEPGADLAAFARAIQDAAATRGRVDVLVTNHLLPMPRESLVEAVQLTPQLWNAQQDRFLNAPYQAAHAAGQIMLSQRRGSIVQLGPAHGLFAQARSAAYCAAAAGLFMLTKALAVEWAMAGVRVNALACGALPDAGHEPALIPDQALLGRIPMGRRATYYELVQAVLFAAGDEASYMTGEVMRVDGGWTAYHLFVPFEGAF